MNHSSDSSGSIVFFLSIFFMFSASWCALAQPPYPQSPVIVDVKWAPVSQIIRLAKGSDNWPMTWADDGNLYTAYGDGNGFKPFTERKLSLGLARVFGFPPNIRAENIRSQSGETIGDGKKGGKASGLLMIDGLLYMFVRNTGNSQLTWSKDHGKTWTKCEWKFTESFGCPTFLNFGKNYQDSRDEYVYIYSQDSDSAYDAADGMVLARVHKKQLTNRDAYQFFVKLTPQNNPQWTNNIHQRGAVFEFKNGCYRSGISYNPGLKRYLWRQTLPGDAPRFKGGFAIYDAPEPWGPWTTAYFVDQWDVGPGETGVFPVKWISDDGRFAYLVFSGDDYFSVRKAEFILVSDNKGINSAAMLFPEENWTETSPEEQGIDSVKLREAVAYLKSNSGKEGVSELVIIRNGRMIWKGDNIDKMHGVWSLTKLFTSTVLGLLIDDGKTKLDSPAKDYIPQMAQGYPNLTLRHFTTMTSGYRAKGDEPRGGYAHGPSKTPFIPDPVPLFSPPGSKYAYWDSAMKQFANVLTRIANEPIEDLLKRRIADPIGMNRAKWDWGDFGAVDGIVVNGGSGNTNKHMFISARELDEEDHLDSFIARESAKFMRRHRDQPFFLVTSFMKPHSPFYPPREYAEKYPVDKMLLPPVGDISSYPKHIQNRIKNTQRQDAKRLKAHRSGYLGNLAFVDTCVGYVYKELEDLGLLDNTIVVYTSDHGEMEGDHGLYQKFCLFEPSVAVPLIVSYPGRIPRNKVTNALTEYFGLYPTLSDLAGLPKPKGTTTVTMPDAPKNMDACSFADLLYDPGTNGPDAAFCEFALKSDIPRYMIRTPQYKYIYNQGAMHELYDHQDDPGEKTNLINKPGLEHVKSQLLDQLVAWYDPANNPYSKQG